jgi:hypothetical protein
MKTREESYMPDTRTLLFVHNIDSGVLTSLQDYSTSKAAGSGSGACVLTRITHSPVGIKKEWKRFLKDLSIPSRSLDRNEFLHEFGNRPLTFPVVLFKNGSELPVLISTEELNRCRDLNDLMLLVRDALLTI